MLCLCINLLKKIGHRFAGTDIEVFSSKVKGLTGLSVI